MRIDTRFDPGQPVVYNGREYVVACLDARGYRDGRVVERYNIEHVLSSGDKVTSNVDVRHLSPVEAPAPDHPTIDDEGTFHYQGYHIEKCDGGVIIHPSPLFFSSWTQKNLDDALRAIHVVES